MDDDYDFGDAWVAAEKEAAKAYELASDFIKQYNEEDEIIQSERSLQEAHMAILNSITMELRAMRMFLVARFHND